MAHLVGEQPMWLSHRLFRHDLAKASGALVLKIPKNGYSWESGDPSVKFASGMRL